MPHVAAARAALGNASRRVWAEPLSVLRYVIRNFLSHWGPPLFDANSTIRDVLERGRGNPLQMRSAEDMEVVLRAPEAVQLGITEGTTLGRLEEFADEVYTFRLRASGLGTPVPGGGIRIPSALQRRRRAPI